MNDRTVTNVLFYVIATFLLQASSEGSNIIFLKHLFFLSKNSNQYEAVHYGALIDQQMEHGHTFIINNQNWA